MCGHSIFQISHPLTSVSLLGDSHTKPKVKTCFDLEVGNIRKLENGANHIKVGFSNSFRDETGILYSPYMPDNGVKIRNSKLAFSVYFC
jgi:hypothetical protein